MIIESDHHFQVPEMRRIWATEQSTEQSNEQNTKLLKKLVNNLLNNPAEQFSLEDYSHQVNGSTCWESWDSALAWDEFWNEFWGWVHERMLSPRVSFSKSKIMRETRGDFGDRLKPLTRLWVRILRLNFSNGALQWQGNVTDSRRRRV